MRKPRTRHRTPGLAGIISTVLLLITYALVIIAVMSFAGVGATRLRLADPAQQFDVLSVHGDAIFGARASARSSPGCSS